MRTDIQSRFMADNRAAQALRQVFAKKTQVEVSRVTGISQPHLSRLASGEKVANDRSDALALRAAEGIELEWWDEPPLPAEHSAGAA